MTSISCLVPFSLALTQPPTPGSTWHSPQVTSRCGPVSYAISSGPIWWQRPQKSAVSVQWMSVIPVQIPAKANAPTTSSKPKTPRRDRGS